MGIIEAFEGIAEKVIWIVNLITDAFVEVHSALNDFYTMLRDFNDVILQATVDPSTNTGLPVVQAIGVIRYLVGEVAFHVLYLCILFGCLFTIYKLVCLLIEAWHAIRDQASAGSYSGSAIAGMITRFFR